MKIRVVGDIHGKFETYKRVIADSEHSIQLGDFNVGYRNEGGKEFDDAVHKWQTQNLTHKFIRGNHDNLTICKNMPNYISDGSYDPNTRIFCCGGAFSIDREFNIEGVSWWPDEELTQREFNHVIDAYAKTKPRIVMTHDFPKSVIYPLFKAQYAEDSITRQALSAMFEIHQPELWIAGHWHIHRKEIINSTQFVCLGELQHMDIEV